MRLADHQRDSSPHPGAGRRPRSHRRAPDRHGLSRLLHSHAIPVVVAGLVLAVIVAVLASSMGGSSGRAGRGAAATPSASTEPPIELTSEESRALTAWLAGNTRTGARLVVPPSVATAVRERVPGRSVRSYDEAGAGVADLVVTVPGQQLRHWPRVARLAERSMPLAALPGTHDVQVRQVVPATAGAGSASTAATEQRERAAAGAELARNPRLRLGRESARALRRGDADPRLLVVLAALAARHDLTGTLLADPTVRPGSLRFTFGATAVDGVAVAGHHSVAAPVRSFLRVQRAPLRPAEARVRATDGGPAFVVRYAAPVPLGLLHGKEIPTVGP